MPSVAQTVWYDFDGDGILEGLQRSYSNKGSSPYLLQWNKPVISNGKVSFNPIKWGDVEIYNVNHVADFNNDGVMDVCGENEAYISGSDMKLTKVFAAPQDNHVKLYGADIYNNGHMGLIYMPYSDGYTPSKSLTIIGDDTPVTGHLSITSLKDFHKSQGGFSVGLPSLADGMFVGGGGKFSVRFAEFSSNDITGDGISDIYNPKNGMVYGGTGKGDYVELQMGGNMKMRDLDGNGSMDFITYDQTSRTLQILFVNPDGSTTSKQLIKGLYCNAKLWIYDFDKDGDYDILVPFDYEVSGHKNGGSYLVMFENKGNRSFKKYENFIEGNLRFIECLDINADGNYEVVAQDWDNDIKWYEFAIKGLSIDNNAKKIGEKINATLLDLENSGKMMLVELDTTWWYPGKVISLTDKANACPQPPVEAPSLHYNPSSELLYVTWQRGSDTESSALDLTYEIRVSTEPGKGDFVRAHALSDGTRRNHLEGREGYNTTRVFNVSSWPAGTYYIDVQAIDPNHRGSKFSRHAVWTKNIPSSAFILDYTRPFGMMDICKISATTEPINGHMYKWDLDGGKIIESNDDNTIIKVIFDTPGIKNIRLSTIDCNGNIKNTSLQTMEVKSANLKQYSDWWQTPILSADLDADGKNEVWAAIRENSHYDYRILKEDEDGAWNPINKIFNTNLPYYKNAFCADINRDGLPDIISFKDKFKMLNMGDMDMEISDFAYSPYNIQLISDLDNNGLLEIMHQNGSIEKCNPDYTIDPNILTSNYIAGDIIKVFDIDGDGLSDIVSAYNGKVYAHLNDGQYGFERSAHNFNFNYPSDTTIRIYEVADFDNDGLLDVLCNINDRLHILWNTVQKESVNSKNDSTDLKLSFLGNVTLLDIDNNGYEDIIVYNQRGESFIIHFYSGRKFRMESRNSSSDETNETVVKISRPFFSNYDNELLTYASIDYMDRTGIIKAVNTRPDAPTGVVVNETERGVVIDWNHAVDKETPGIKMRYNISVRHKGAEGEGAYLISPMNGEVDYAPVPQSSDWRCNDILWSGNRFLIPRNAIANGEYVVRIQAIDAMMATSAFSAPVEFTVKGGGFGTVPSAVKVGAEAKIVTADHVDGNIDWDGGKVIAHNGHSYTVTWSKEGVKTISDGTYTAQLNVLKPADASFFGIPDEVTVLDKCNAACATAADGRWEVSFDGVDFKLVSDVEVKHAEFEIDPSANRITMQFGTTGDVYVRHTVAAPYGEEVFTKKYTVRRASERPAIDIVDIDPATGRLRITPTEQTADHVIGWNIYRETSVANKYELIGTILKGSGNRSFVDPLSEPSSHPSRYTLSWILDYGESLECEPHQSLHVMINRAAGNAINLMWSPYEGREVASYRILRGATVASMTPIATVSGSVRSYADLTPDVAQPLYSVEMVCKAETRADATSVRSNVVSTADAYYTTMVSGIEIISDGNRTDIGGDNFSDLQLNAVVTPITANYRNVHWAVVAGEDIATVSSSGLVEMKDDVPSGTVVIRALAMDGSGAYGEITLNAMSAIGDTRVDRMADGELTCSPWAVDTDLTVDGMTDGELTHLIIFDLSGVVCKSVEVDGSSVTLSVDNLVPGHYFVRAESRSGISKGRFVKK